MAAVYQARTGTRLGVVAAVGVLHLVILVALGVSGVVSSGLPPVQEPFDVFLVPPAPPPPPLSPTAPENPGGGAPAAASRIHVPLEPPPPQPPELIAPVQPAPETQVLVGVAAEADAVGMGLGGRGAGLGTGLDAGAGTAAGGGAPASRLVGARLLRRPSSSEVNRSYPIAARRAGISGQAIIACTVRLDTRLENCRVLAETPMEGQFGQAGVQLAQSYRYAPPQRDGRAEEGHQVAFSVDYVCRLSGRSLCRPR